MKRIEITMSKGFKVLLQTKHGQAATMSLAPGSSTGGPQNKHRNSDQWLYVTSGSGKAVVEGKEITLQAGTLILIERGETHEITNNRDQPLETINIYTPPAY